MASRLRGRHDGGRHHPDEQAAVVPDRARRCHRHHLDRRHDLDHPGLRRVAARQHQADGARDDLPRAVQRRQLRGRHPDDRVDEAAQPQAGRGGHRAAGAERGDGGPPARRGGPADAAAHVLRAEAHQADEDRRDDRGVPGGAAHQPHGGPILHRAGSEEPPQGDRARPGPVPGAVRVRRSDRQDHPDGHRAVHGDRRHRQAPLARELQPRSGRIGVIPETTYQKQFGLRLFRATAWASIAPS